MLSDALKQLTEKQSLLQQELVHSDQMLTAARTELEAFKATIERLKKERSAKGFTKSEMMSLISDRNYYKEKFMELHEAIKLMETLRASQRGHPELLKDLPPSVTDVQLHPPTASPQHQLRNALAKL